jgi:signal transduction histidine kinase
MDNARLHTQAQQAIRTRDELLAVVAHDLGNPLSGISVVARILRDRGHADFDEETVALLEGTYDSSKQMGRLIDDLLTVSQMESVGLTVHPSRTNVRDLIIPLAATMRPLAESAGLTLTVEVAEGLPDITGDVDRVSQILWNLVGNSVKFTDRGGAVSIRATPGVQAVQFSVEDDGPGIPVDAQRHVFDRFAQDQPRGGIGLGLAIAKGLVEAHGGRIWIESAAGIGCTVHFTIPSAEFAASD